MTLFTELPASISPQITDDRGCVQALSLNISISIEGSGGGEGGLGGGRGGGSGGGCTIIPEEPTLLVDWSRPTTETPPTKITVISMSEATNSVLFSVAYHSSVLTILGIPDLI